MCILPVNFGEKKNAIFCVSMSSGIEEWKREGVSPVQLGKLFENKTIKETLFCCKRLFYVQKAIEKLLVHKL